MFIQSLRWKLVLWLALILGCVLAGFGVTAYELHRTNQFNQIDQELRRRVAALNTALHGPPEFEAGGGRNRFGDGSNAPLIRPPIIPACMTAGTTHHRSAPGVEALQPPDLGN